MGCVSCSDRRRTGSACAASSNPTFEAEQPHTLVALGLVFCHILRRPKVPVLGSSLDILVTPLGSQPSSSAATATLHKATSLRRKLCLFKSLQPRHPCLSRHCQTACFSTTIAALLKKTLRVSKQVLTHSTFTLYPDIPYKTIQSISAQHTSPRTAHLPVAFLRLQSLSFQLCLVSFCVPLQRFSSSRLAITARVLTECNLLVSISREKKYCLCSFQINYI